MFGPSGPCESSPVDVRPLEAYLIIVDLGLKLDSDFKLGSQIRAAVKSSFIINVTGKCKLFL